MRLSFILCALAAAVSPRAHLRPRKVPLVNLSSQLASPEVHLRAAQAAAAVVLQAEFDLSKEERRLLEDLVDSLNLAVKLSVDTKHAAVASGLVRPVTKALKVMEAEAAKVPDEPKRVDTLLALGALTDNLLMAMASSQNQASVLVDHQPGERAKLRLESPTETAPTTTVAPLVSETEPALEVKSDE